MIRHEPTLNIRHFAALAATVRHGSVTRAARAVNLTQPALTQADVRTRWPDGSVGRPP